jgi:integrase
MARFSSPEKQSSSVIKELQTEAIKSLGTVRNYEQALKNVSSYLSENKLGSLRDMTPESAISYLNKRASEVGQKALDMERQAIQSMLKNVTNKLDQDKHLEVVKTLKDEKLTSRAYTNQQAKIIAASQTPKNSLSTKIAAACGLRAHELLTLKRESEKQADDRPVHQNKFTGLQEKSIAYTVTGKGGLTREVMIPRDLAYKLENTRLDQPRIVKDRGVRYTQHYNINGGQRWSNSFSAASLRAFGWSRGAHGLRHSYAQNRMHVLQKEYGVSREDSLKAVSQEMGHQRISIVEVYLR